MRAYFSKFFTLPLTSEQRLEKTNSKHGEMRIGILLGGILLNTTVDHLNLQGEMAELKRAK